MQNIHYDNIKNILENIKAVYIEKWKKRDPTVCITERDMVSEIYCYLKEYASKHNLYVHTEVKYKIDGSKNVGKKGSHIIDVALLENRGDKSWFNDAINKQDKYMKGNIEARFSSVSLEYFNVAIEVKIQSKPADSYRDIAKLKKLKDLNNSVNCFFVLLNARGIRKDHEMISTKAKQNEIDLIEYTANTDEKRGAKTRDSRHENTPTDQSMHCETENITSYNNDKVTTLIETIKRTLKNNFNIKHKFVKLNQDKFWLSDYKENQKCCMIVERFKRKDSIRVHVIQGQDWLEGIVQQINLSIKPQLQPSNLNQMDHFKAALEFFSINSLSEDDLSIIIKLIREIVLNVKEMDIGVKRKV